MCEFISWLEDRETKEILYLNDNLIYNTKRGKKLQKELETWPSDMVGHGAILAYYHLEEKYNKFEHYETSISSFKKPKNIPLQIQQDFKDGLFKKMSYISGSFSFLDVVPKVKKETMVAIFEYVDGIQFTGKAKKLSETLKENCKQALKQTFTGKDYGGSGSIVKFINWSETEQGSVFWRDYESYFPVLEVDFVKLAIDKFWDLFKNPKNRIKAWR